MNGFDTYTLANGLRIICAHADSEVVYCGVAVDAGTRDEQPNESGMAHFTEHMSFKGTHRRSARQIINRMECVGGDLNAYTGKEETVYYATFLRQHLARAIDVLLDIVLHSTYPQEEMNREVEVVIDEIESYNDQPSELIYDEFEEMLFPNHPLGRNILGAADKLRQIQSEDMQAFTRRLYHPSHMVLYVYGRVDPQQVFRLAEKAFLDAVCHGELHGGGLERRAADRIPLLSNEKERTMVRQLHTHQAHVMMGTRSFGGSDPRHLHLYLLNNILGGPAMGSRLNLALRERNGLVYTVESNAVCYTDSGVWSTYFGCDPGDVGRCQKLVMRELQRLTDAPLSQRALDAARRQLKGQVGISYDNGESVAIGMAKRYLHYHTTQTMQQLFDLLDDLTPQALWDTAQEVFRPEGMRTLIYQ